MEDAPTDSNVYEEWKKDITKKLTNVVIFKKNLTTVMKRCPKCLDLTLEFDPKTSRLHCTQCGFEEHFNL
ncbi:MAG: hypothetical protein AABX47_01925 [Nanoarchaeota archaeon]